MKIGRIHSIQSFGAVDGPGLRSVIFFQGCPLRCAYCHNPDTWDNSSGYDISIDDIVQKVKRFYPYIKNGGVTLSGGECLRQPEFAKELLSEFKRLELHTAIDTSGICDLTKASEVLKSTDLVICDIKFATDSEYKKHTGGSLKTVQSFLELTESMGIPLWIRHVVIPGITDSESYAKSIVDAGARYTNLQKLEFLPFRKICTPKYEALKIDFKFGDIPECDSATIEKLRGLIPSQYK